MKKKLAIYIHIPFCVRKCAYCDFLSAPATQELQKQYVGALVREIRDWEKWYPGRKDCYLVGSVFFGGGTPSILQPGLLAGVADAVRDSFEIACDAEITVECNPGTLDAEKLRVYRAVGVNRLSIGLQSSENEELLLLGRIHTWDDFLKSYALAREAGFDNLNIDLMSALPGQTLQSWQNTLHKVLALQPEHISAYSLIIEEGTPFYERYGGKESTMLPDEDTERRMYAGTGQILKETGYHRYEISNYALPGRECRHNICYWDGTEYLGFGTGAASLFGKERFCRIRDTQEYIAAVTNETDTRIERNVRSKKEHMEEFMFLGLRMMRGISKAEFADCFGVTMDKVYSAVLKKYISYGLLREDGDRIFLTPEGIDVSNVIFQEFLLD